MSNSDHKTYWDLFETVIWIYSRSEEKLAAMWGWSDEDKASAIIFGMRVRMVMHSPPDLGSGRGAIMEAAVLEANGSTMDAHHPFEDLLRKVHSRRVWMTAINFRDPNERQIEVPLVEMNDLQFRMIPGNRGVVAGLWSRSREALVWKSPQFLRADVIGAWPAPRTKTAAFPGAILRHLRQIMTPEGRLTKAEARQRCLAEVANAYPEAFKRAWDQLEASYKRRRGNHGKRAH
jgi:hypothetical protein